MNGEAESVTVLWPILLAVAGALLVVLVVGGIVALRFVGRDTAAPLTASENLTIDLAALAVTRPPIEGPRLEYFGTPVRLVVLVLAPSGRADLPPKEQLRETVDSIVPELSKVLDAHQPIFRHWKEQLSTPGFVQAFLRNMALPGDRGKGTPWCAIAGQFESRGRQYLTGLICYADSANSLSQVVAKYTGQWLDTLRVRN